MTDAEAAVQARVSELAASLAHELKNHLSAIVGFAELLALRDDEATRREAATMILEASRALSARIDELLVGEQS